MSGLYPQSLPVGLNARVIDTYLVRDAHKRLHAGYTQTRRVYLSIRNVQPIWDITLIPFDPPLPTLASPSSRGSSWRQHRKILHNVGVSTGTLDFYRDLFFNAPRNDSLRECIYIYIRTNMGKKESRKREWKGTRIESLEARVFKKKKGEDRRLDVSPRTRWPRGENKSRFCLTLDTHYIFLNIVRQDTRVITYVVRLHMAGRWLTSMLVGEDTSVIFHPREMYRSADVYRYLFLRSSLCNGDSAVLTQSISFGDSGS